jgi:hypothetical protein
VRVRGVGVHAPSHRLVWLIERKRRASRLIPQAIE